MELSFGEILIIAVVVVVLFGPDKLPSIARDFGHGVRKFRGAVEDIKTEILKETDSPLSEIKHQIDEVKISVQNSDPERNIASEDFSDKENEKLYLLEDENHSGPVARR
ncbi:MAG: twin-arginine translocase TatA/TatE family subunit [Bergeyella sp.]|nr:twin-arginine translocase TatA/TatE family subunit [Bergeyella sp.]